MDFQTEIKQLSERINKLKGNIQTEEATKHSFVMPFLKALGYDIFDPTVVVPEFIADIGTKKGEKVDYAILEDGKPLILIEVKHHTAKLDNHNSQLLRYFTVTSAKFGILTNGVEYRFYTDLDEKNKMDSKAFFTIDLDNLKDRNIKDLQQFAKDSLNVDTILSMASKKKYVLEIQNILKAELKEPSDEFIRIFAKRMTDKPLTQILLEEYRNLSKMAFGEIINDIVSDKINSLQAGFKAEIDKQQEDDEAAIEQKKENEIITTQEELEGYYIVKSIIAEICSVSDITCKDTASYFGVLYKNNSWKWICRLYFNSKQKYISFPADNKKEEKIPLEHIENIYNHRDRIKEIVSKFI